MTRERLLWACAIALATIALLVVLRVTVFAPAEPLIGPGVDPQWFAQ